MIKEFLNDKVNKLLILLILSISILMCLTLILISLSQIIPLLLEGQIVAGVFNIIPVLGWLFLVSIGVWIIYRDFIRK